MPEKYLSFLSIYSTLGSIIYTFYGSQMYFGYILKLVVSTTDNIRAGAKILFV